MSDHHCDFEIRVLGPLAVVGADGALHPGGPKPRLVLALLTAAAGSVLTVDHLIDGLWGDEPPATARKTLQVHVSGLRRNLGSSFPIETVRNGYRLALDDVHIDALDFEADVERARSLLETTPADARRVLAQTLARWSGSAYADLADEPSIRPAAVGLNELRLSAVVHRIDADLRLGSHERVLGELEALTAEHPFHEPLCALQRLALYRAGRQTEALRAYGRARRALADELGLEPGPDLQRLHHQVLDHSAELSLAVHAHQHSVSRVAVGVGPGGTTIAPTRPDDDSSDLAGGVRGYEFRELLRRRDGVAIHRAFQPALGREVALRVFATEIANGPRFLKWFDTECDARAALDHPHIVTLYDSWRDPDGAYMAMQLVRGGTLDASLVGSLWEPRDALRLLEQVGSALSHARSRGMVHGAIGPNDILLDDDRNAFLTNFVTSSETPGNGESSHAHVRDVAVLASRMIAGAEPGDVEFTPVAVPAEFVGVLRRATDADPARRFDDVDTLLGALRDAFGSDRSKVEVSGPVEARNPFKGLRAFGERDAGDFFGRDALVEQLRESVSVRGITAVVGPSGSGKSSLVRAGLVPAVRRHGLRKGRNRDVVVAEMIPGTQPFEELASALLRVSVRRPHDLVTQLNSDSSGLTGIADNLLPDDSTDLLVVIDQFEELFSLVPDEATRSAFLDALTATVKHPSDRVRIVLTLRADFYDQPLRYPEFGTLLSSSLLSVTLPDEHSLTAAITEPLRRVGLHIEPELVQAILRDVADERGALPLLQYALTELVDRRLSDHLTLDDYHRTGGVLGALATRADDVYGALSHDAQHAAREILVRLATVNHDADDTRRRVRRSELNELGLGPDAVERVLDAYGSCRLVTFDNDPVTRGPTVEIAHEALLREWPRYRTWIDERRDDLRTQRRLDAAVAEWRQADHDAGFLISGARLDRYERWIDTSAPRLTADEHAFIDTSRRTEDQRQERAHRRRRRVSTLLVSLTLAALAAAAIAIVQQRRADDQAQTAATNAALADDLRVEAQNSARIDGARVLATQAVEMNDPDVRLSLALEAYDRLDADSEGDPTVTSLLYQHTIDHDLGLRVPPVNADDDGSAGLAADESGEQIVQTFGDRARVIDTRTGDVRAEVEFDSLGSAKRSTWDESTGSVLVGTSDRILRWRPSSSEDGEEYFEPPPSSNVVTSLFATERWLGTAESNSWLLAGDLFFLRVRDRSSLESVLFELPAQVSDAQLSPDERFLVTVGAAGDINLYETNDWTQLDGENAPRGWNDLVSDAVTWGPDGTSLWVLADGSVAGFDVGGGQIAEPFPVTGAAYSSIAVSRDGRLLAVAAPRDPVHVYELTDGRLVSRLQSTPAVIDPGYGMVPRAEFDRLEWLPERRLAVSNPETTIWDLGQVNADVVATSTETTPVFVDVATGGNLIVGTQAGGVDVYDDQGSALVRRHEPRGEPGTLPVISADGTTMLLPTADDVEVVDVLTGEARTSGPDEYTHPVGLSPDGTRALLRTSGTSSTSPVLSMIDTTTGERIGDAVAANMRSNPANFTSDGELAIVPRRIVHNSGDPGRSNLVVLDMSTGAVEATSAPQRCLEHVAISGDDRLVATIGCDGAVVVFDLETLLGDEPFDAEVARNDRSSDAGAGVTFDSDDELVIVTRKNGEVQAFEAGDEFDLAWEFDLGETAAEPTVHDGRLLIPSRSRYAVSGDVGDIVSLPLELDELVALARSSLTRELTDAERDELLAEIDDG